jgi:hypothetical protein
MPATVILVWHWSWHSAGVIAPRLICEIVPLAHAEAVVVVVHRSVTAKVAVTFTSAAMETVQVPVPVQPPPDHPVKVEPAAGVAARTTLLVPGANSSEHVVPQSMVSSGVVDATVPVPVPALLTVKAYCPAAQLPPALVPLPVKSPLRHQHTPVPLSRSQHPVVIPAAAIPVSHWSWHCAPVSPPPRFTAATAPSLQPKAVAVVHPSAGTNVAVTVVAAVTDTVQVPVPEQPPPDQLLNAEPALAAAVRTTLVP